MALMQVRYKGLSDYREMSQEDLATVGIHLETALKWNRNGSVYIESPSDDLLSLFEREGTFQVTEVDEKGSPVGDDSIIKHSKVDDTGLTVVDGVTGQTSIKGENKKP